MGSPKKSKGQKSKTLKSVPTRWRAVGTSIYLVDAGRWTTRLRVASCQVTLAYGVKIPYEHACVHAKIMAAAPELMESLRAIVLLAHTRLKAKRLTKLEKENLQKIKEDAMEALCLVGGSDV